MTSKFSPPYFLTFIICFLLWLLLTASIAVDEVVSGLLLSLVVSWLTAPKMQILEGLYIHVGMFLAMVKYLGYFFVALVKANLDLAGRVLSKEIIISPGFVEIKTTMQSDLGKLLLANSITLTPGTLSVDVLDDHMIVHWIDSPDQADMELSTRAIVDKFEDYLKGFVK